MISCNFFIFFISHFLISWAWYINKLAVFLYKKLAAFTFIFHIPRFSLVKSWYLAIYSSSLSFSLLSPWAWYVDKLTVFLFNKLAALHILIYELVWYRRHVGTNRTIWQTLKEDEHKARTYLNDIGAYNVNCCAILLTRIYLHNWRIQRHNNGNRYVKFPSMVC